jgi:hypothetical protein
MIKELVQVSVAVFCAMSGFRGAAAEKAATVGRPNFVLCMADDQPPSPPAPIPALTVSGAAGTKANSCKKIPNKTGGEC